MKLLLEKAAEVEAKDNKGNAPLMLARNEGIKKLLEAGKNRRLSVEPLILSQSQSESPLPLSYSLVD